MTCKCGHTDKEHCKGNVDHITHRDQVRMVPKPQTFKCPTRHCEVGMCSCVEYREAA